jgi:serine/threonine-protein kinase
MELLEGESVQQLLAREQRLTATEAVRLLLPIADALRAAHAKGIVHRDIKPDNVFVSRDASGGGGIQPKLVDFGIAKLEKRDVDSHLTQKGAVLGSPDYMSPEQARGEEDIDYRADIWSFCVLLYEAISGEPPFAGTNYNALLRAIVETRATTLEERCVADNELSTIVATGMMKERKLRWDSMLDLGDALAVWLLKQGVYEDAAGGSVEAKWITRRTDPTNPRLSRPTFPSEPGSFRGAPGTTTARRLAGEAPTSVGPVVTGSGPSVRRRLFVPGLVGLAMGVAAFIGWRAMQTDVPPQKPAALVPVAAAPTVEAAPPARLEVAEPRPAVSAPSASPVQPKSPKARQRTQSAAPKPGQPKLDLLAPY